MLGETDPISSNLAAQPCLSSLPSSSQGKVRQSPGGFELNVSDTAGPGAQETRVPVLALSHISWWSQPASTRLLYL